MTGYWYNELAYVVCCTWCSVSCALITRFSQVFVRHDIVWLGFAYHSLCRELLHTKIC